MTDILIRTVPHHVIAAIDDLADAAGLSRQAYLHTYLTRLARAGLGARVAHSLTDVSTHDGARGGVTPVSECHVAMRMVLQTIGKKKR